MERSVRVEISTNQPALPQATKRGLRPKDGMVRLDLELAAIGCR